MNSQRKAARTGVAVAVGVGVGLGAAAAIALCAVVIQQKRKRQPLEEREWKAAFDEEGRLTNFHELCQQILQGGIEPGLRSRVWPFLLRLYASNSTSDKRSTVLADLTRRYNDLLHICQELETALEGSVVRRGAGVSAAGGAEAADVIPAHLAQFAEAQRIIVLDAVRTDLTHHAGVATSTEPAVSVMANGEARGGVWSSRVAEETLSGATHLTAEHRRQARRLMHLLSAYAVHDPETGYCQGMSDLAAPFLEVFPDDTLAFWCFERLMVRTRRNFRHDQAGIREQLGQLGRVLEGADPVLFHRLRQVGAGELLFAYRLIVVQVRREVSLAGALALWEVLWAAALLDQVGACDPNGSPIWVMDATTAGPGIHHTPANPAQGRGSWAASSSSETGSQASGGSSGAGGRAAPPDLLTYFIVAIIRSQRRKVLDDCHGVDDVLRLFHSLKVDVWTTLGKARHLQRSLMLDGPQ